MEKFLCCRSCLLIMLSSAFLMFLSFVVWIYLRIHLWNLKGEFDVNWPQKKEVDYWTDQSELFLPEPLIVMYLMFGRFRMSSRCRLGLFR